MKQLWEIQIRFDGDAWRTRRVTAEEVLLGAHPDAKLRFPHLPENSLLRVSFDGKKLAVKSEAEGPKLESLDKSDHSLHFKFAKTEFRVSLVQDERSQSRFEPESWAASFDKFEKNSYSLWHLRDGQLVESVFLDASGTPLLLKCGFEIVWKGIDDPSRFVIREHNSDIHTVSMVEGRHGALRAGYGNELFIITPVPERTLLSKLDQPLVREPVDTASRRAFVGLVASVVLLLSLIGLLPESAPKDLPLEELSPEMAKVVLEAPRQKKGGDGMTGGGGIDTEHYDRKGGSGLAALDNLVKDKNTPMGGKGVLSALSALDEGVKVGKFKTAGLVPSNVGQKMLGTAQGVLGALGKIQGVGGGGGVGIGGVGTKGFGGGGGGGNGKGFGTGVGNGLGTGDGTRNVIFESENSLVKGGLDRSEVDAVVQENISQIRFCYNRGLRSNPKMQGKVISAFVIGGDGTVSKSRLKDSTLAAPEVEDCIKSRIALWKFPKPRGGGEVTVNYPFLLKSN